MEVFRVSPGFVHLYCVTFSDSKTRRPRQAGAQLAAPLRVPPKPQGSPVEPLLKNVFLNARGNKSMNGLAALGAFARFRGGDVA